MQPAAETQGIELRDAGGHIGACSNASDNALALQVFDDATDGAIHRAHLQAPRRCRRIESSPINQLGSASLNFSRITVACNGESIAAANFTRLSGVILASIFATPHRTVSWFLAPSNTVARSVMLGLIHDEMLVVLFCRVLEGKNMEGRRFCKGLLSTRRQRQPQ
jgi:hypothetical protein